MCFRQINITTPPLRLTTYDCYGSAPPLTGVLDALGATFVLQPAELELSRDADGRKQLLGAGGFAAVYRAVLRGVDQVAVKVLKVRSVGSCVREFRGLQFGKCGYVCRGSGSSRGEMCLGSSGSSRGMAFRVLRVGSVRGEGVGCNNGLTPRLPE